MGLSSSVRQRRNPVWLHCVAFLAASTFALSVGRDGSAVGADSFSREQRDVFGRCETSSPSTQVADCSAAIDSKLFHGAQLAFLLANRANAYDAAGDKAAALKDYNQSLQLAPESAATYLNRGVFFVGQQDYDLALKDYNSVLRLEPGSVDALFNRARIFEYKHEDAAAIADYSEAIRIEPGAAAAYQQRGLVFIHERDLKRAIEDENAAIRLEPQLAMAYFFRAMAYSGTGDNTKASADIQTAIRLEPALKRFVKTNGENLSLAQPQ